MYTHIQRTIQCFVFIETAIQISTVIGKRISFKCIHIMREGGGGDPLINFFS